VLTAGRQDSRRLADATNIIKPGVLVTTEALNGNGAGTAAIGVERSVAAASILCLVGGDTRDFREAEPELDLSVENTGSFDKETPDPMILDKALVLGGFVTEPGTSHGTHAEDIDVDRVVETDHVEDLLRNVTRGIVALERHLRAAIATGGKGRWHS
jgi:hypothetical protein